MHFDDEARLKMEELERILIKGEEEARMAMREMRVCV
jgi:hypothetical protein